MLNKLPRLIKGLEGYTPIVKWFDNNFGGKELFFTTLMISI